MKIVLNQGYEAIVDDRDYEELSKYKWHIRTCCGFLHYAVRSFRVHGASKTEAMHRRILHVPKGLEVDHINGDGLDNRRANLRLCSRQQNAFNGHKRANASGFKGVVWHKGAGRWRAKIMKNHTTVHLGYFNFPEDAGRAYDRAARELFGEFARVNFPNEVSK